MRDKKNPFMVIPEADLGKVKTSQMLIMPGFQGTIQYLFDFYAPMSKGVIIHPKKVKKLFNQIRRTLKAYMKEAEKA